MVPNKYDYLHALDSAGFSYTVKGNKILFGDFVGSFPGFVAEAKGSTIVVDETETFNDPMDFEAWLLNK